MTLLLYESASFASLYWSRQSLYLSKIMRRNNNSLYTFASYFCDSKVIVGGCFDPTQLGSMSSNRCRITLDSIQLQQLSNFLAPTCMSSPQTDQTLASAINWYSNHWSNTSMTLFSPHMKKLKRRHNAGSGTLQKSVLEANYSTVRAYEHCLHVINSNDDYVAWIN